MTIKQVDELRRLHRRVIAEPWDVNDAPVLICRENAAFLVAANNQLARVLDERDMLLAFVKRLSLDYPSCALCNESAAVIAKAEAP